MQPLRAVLQSQGLKVSLTGEECLHTYRSEGKEVVKRFRKVLLQGEAVCPMCMKEAADKVLQDEEEAQRDRKERERKRNMLKKHSIIGNESITGVRLADYRTDCWETAQNKQLVQETLSRLKTGEQLNVIIAGLQGTGKSHLAYAMLHELCEHFYDLSGGDVTQYDRMKSCLFVEVEKLLRLIKDSFRNKDSWYTEENCVRLMVEADYLVLDDLGAESGSMNRGDEEATNFVQRVLYAVANGRQNKTTITTTNLSSKAIFQKYDKKLGSRLLNKAVPVVFKSASDKRIEHLGF